MASVLSTWTADSGRPGLVAASESGSASLTVDEVISRSPRGKLFPESRSLAHGDAVDDILQTWELIAIILSSAFVMAAVVIVAVWLHRRRSSSKISDLNASHDGQLEAVVVVTSYEKTPDAASPVNLVSFQEATDGDDESVYGSVVDSLPPSPTLSFRSVIEGPGLSRSRAGTGTSFGTVASIESVRSCRSHWSVADVEIPGQRYQLQLP